MKLLEILLQHSGKVVTREELRSRSLAQRKFRVDFDQGAQYRHREAFRSALGDSAESPRFIGDSSETWLSLYCGRLRLSIQTPVHKKARSCGWGSSRLQTVGMRSKASG